MAQRRHRGSASGGRRGREDGAASGMGGREDFCGAASGMGGRRQPWGRSQQHSGKKKFGREDPGASRGSGVTPHTRLGVRTGSLWVCFLNCVEQSAQIPCHVIQTVILFKIKNKARPSAPVTCTEFLIVLLRWEEPVFTFEAEKC